MDLNLDLNIWIWF